MKSQEWEDTKDELIRDLTDLYQTYYPNDLEWWDLGQLVDIFERSVELGIMHHDRITEELVQDYLVRIRAWLLKLRPVHGSLFGLEVGDLQDLNPRSPSKLGPKTTSLKRDYDTWVRTIKLKYRTYAPFIQFNTYGKEGDQYTKAEWPEKEIAFGRYDWKTMTGKDYKVKFVPMPDEPTAKETASDYKIENWKNQVIAAYKNKVPGFENKVKFNFDSETNQIVAEIPNLLDITGRPQIFGLYDTALNKGIVGKNVNPMDEGEMDPDMEKLEIWKHAVLTKYPSLKDKIRFVSKDQGKHVSAEVPGMDRSFGVFDMDTMTGHVLSESNSVTKKVFEGFVSELDNIAGIYK